MNDMASAVAATGWTVPIAFANWPTTDPLRHPNEPNPHEDLVGVDANHVLPTASWPGGTFASYHVYPYYPDFLQYQPSLQHSVFDGHHDPYAAYVRALQHHHQGVMPVMISEFGVPSSLGSAHPGTLGRGQGDHTEKQAMRMDAQMLREMPNLGMAGAFIFEWTDYAPIPVTSRPAARDGWRQLELVMDKPWWLPVTHRHTAMEFSNVGLLRYGYWTPGQSSYDSLALWHLDGATLDLRIPWAMAGMSDPSSHQALIPQGGFRASSVTIPGIGITISSDGGSVQNTGTVRWDNWPRVRYQERIKVGAAVIRSAFAAVSGRS